MLKKTLANILESSNKDGNTPLTQKKKDHRSKKSTKGCKTSNDSDVEIIEKPEDPEEELSVLAKNLTGT